MTLPLTFSVDSGASVDAFLDHMEEVGALTEERRATVDVRGS
jgi:hypothetical protein